MGPESAEIAGPWCGRSAQSELGSLHPEGHCNISNHCPHLEVRQPNIHLEALLEMLVNGPHQIK